MQCTMCTPGPILALQPLRKVPRPLLAFSVLPTVECWIGALLLSYTFRQDLLHTHTINRTKKYRCVHTHIRSYTSFIKSTRHHSTLAARLFCSSYAVFIIRNSFVSILLRGVWAYTYSSVGKHVQYLLHK